MRQISRASLISFFVPERWQYSSTEISGTAGVSRSGKRSYRRVIGPIRFKETENETEKIIVILGAEAGK